MKGIIYKYTSPSGKVYIGQTIHPHRRHIQHKNSINNKIKTKFICAILKYGFENFKYEIISVVDIDNKEQFHNKLNWMEKYYIKKFNSCENGYNITEGGGGTSGMRLTKETKELLSKLRKGTKKPESFKIYMSNKWKGVSKSKDSIEKRKETIKSKYNNFKGEFNSNYGKHHKHSEETKEKIGFGVRGNKNGMYGKHQSDEVKERISKLNKGRHRVYDNDEHTKWHME